jgi:hypothetical protein
VSEEGNVFDVPGERDVNLQAHGVTPALLDFLNSLEGFPQGAAPRLPQLPRLPRQAAPSPGA